MKKIFILLFISVLVLKVNAQEGIPITKGHIIIGGDLSFKADKYDYEAPGRVDKRDRIHFNTDLSVGYFVINRFAFGLKGGLVLNRDMIDPELNEKYTTHEFQLKLFLRYYTSLGIFAEADIGYGFRTLNYNIFTYEDYISDYNSFTWSSGLGYSLFINKNIAIEPKVVYKSWKRTNASDKAETVKISGLYINIGFQIYFNGRRKQSE